MAHQVAWTKRIVEEFEDKAMLSIDECMILETRVRGWTVTQQADKLNKSVSTVHGMIATLKKKYDLVQAEYPNIFPKRFVSQQENYMDTH